VSNVVPTFGRREERERSSDERGDVFKRARARGAEERFQFGEREFDRIEIGTVGRQESQVRAGALDRGADFRLSMHGEVIENNHIAGPQRRDQDLFDVGAKARAVDRPIEDRRCRDTVRPQGRNHRVRLPMPARRVIAQPQAAWTPPVATEEIGGHATLIDKDVLPGIAER
jgi:hypothetical protein